MANGSKIVIEDMPRGVFRSCIISGTPKPGTVMQVKASTAKANGLFTFEAYNPGADGNRTAIAVLVEDDDQGRTASQAYEDGQIGKVYFPVQGEHLNMLVADVAGTADDHAIGDKMIVDDSTGKLIATTGTPESEPFVLLEAATDPTADALMEAMFTGV